MPITNVHAKGDYTAQLRVGSERHSVNVILDTGSSTLALHPGNYSPVNDHSLRATSFAQDVTYGIGGWTGPVIQTHLELVGDAHHLAMLQSHVAITSVSQSHSFGDADGILGLAYHGLNKSYDLSSYYEQHQISPAATYPWHFPIKANNHSIREFKHFLKQYPEQDITPFFTDLATHGITQNKFAFYTHRSSIHHQSSANDTQERSDDPLNNGIFVLGGGEAETDLFTGDFQSLKVFHDVYYNTHLEGIQIEGGNYLKAPPLEAHYEPLYFTNSIIDSGASAILFQQQLYQELLNSFESINPDYAKIIRSVPAFDGVEKGIQQDDIQLQDWPNIHFYFTDSQNNTTTLSCSPATYWQENAPKFGQLSFKIMSQLGHWPNQSIIGLPLLNNYYTVFDRAEESMGCIKLATLKR